MIYCILKADAVELQRLSWLQQNQYLMSFAPVAFLIYSWLNHVWVYGELIILLTNKRKRAVHDFIAGTVIVKQKHVASIMAAMEERDASGDNSWTA